MKPIANTLTNKSCQRKMVWGGVMLGHIIHSCNINKCISNLSVRTHCWYNLHQPRSKSKIV